MFRLETDMRGLSITRLGVGDNEKGRSCVFMYAEYMRACPIPNDDREADNCLTLWTKTFFTHNEGLSRIGLWEPGVLYRLPQAAMDILMEGDDLCAAPVRVEIRHNPYAAFAVDEHLRGSADTVCPPCTTALHTGAWTPCIVAPRGTLVSWLRLFDDHSENSSLLRLFAESAGLGAFWTYPLFCEGDVRIDHLPYLLDRNVELIREDVSRETA